MTPEQELIAAIAEAIEPDKPIRTSQWAAQYRILPPDSPEPGPWRNDRTPYLVEIMDVLSPKQDCEPVREAYLKKGHQLGGSALGENFCGSTISSAAGNFLAVFATLDDAEKWELNRFEPMRESTPELRKRILDANVKGADNTKKRKKYPGGMLQLVGANRPGALKSTTFRYVLLEEMDEYQGDIGNQGAPEDLAKNRTSNFRNKARIFGNSTPTIEGASPIDRNFKRGDQRKYFVPCPACGHQQFFEWKNFKWPEGQPEKVGCACVECGVIASEREWKLKGLAAGQWKPTAVGEPGVRSYHLPSLYAPLGWRPWSDLAVEFVNVNKDPVRFKKFVNNELAECWQDQSEGMDHEVIQKRALDYPMRSIPKGCLLLVMAVDVQGDRLEYQVLGFGRNKKHWVIDYGVLLGNPARDEVWERLTELRGKPFVNEFGISMRPVACGIDSGGHHTHEVYAYCRRYEHEKVFALKGASELALPIIGTRASSQDVNVNGQAIKSGVKLWRIGTDTAKNMLFGYLSHDKASPVQDQFIHFPAGLSEDYYRQLTSEYFDKIKRRYVKKAGRRNEVVDLFVYCYAAAHFPGIRVDVMQDHEWSVLERHLQPATRDLFSDLPPELEEASSTGVKPEVDAQANNPVPSSVVQQPVAAGGWLDGYGDNWL